MKQKIVFSLLLTASTLSAQEKADCNTLDINKVPGKWVWENLFGIVLQARHRTKTILC